MCQCCQCREPEAPGGAGHGWPTPRAIGQETTRQQHPSVARAEDPGEVPRGSCRNPDRPLSAPNSSTQWHSGCLVLVASTAGTTMALTIKHGSIDQPEANSEMPQCCRLAAAAAAVCLVAGELASERQSVSARATGPGPGPSARGPGHVSHSFFSKASLSIIKRLKRLSFKLPRSRWVSPSRLPVTRSFGLS